MKFKDLLNRYNDLNLEKAMEEVSHRKVESVLAKEYLTIEDYLTLLSPVAKDYLEEMARKAHEITLKFFGKAIVLYAPLYLSDFCENQCIYCGFRNDNPTKRKKLTYEDLEKEARAISDTEIRNILVLTGESEAHAPLKYIEDCVEIIKEYFSSITVEIYPLTREGYRRLIEKGVEGLTIYQEVYDENIYNKVHLKGPKKNYGFRLDAPERGLLAGMKRVNIGALFGLAPWRREAFFTGLHAMYLQNKYPEGEIHVSFPRLQPFQGNKNADFFYEVSDKNLVQMMVALRIFLNRVGINLSTREPPKLRENLIPLGVTRMSAGSITAVGGYSSDYDGGQEQFEVADHRSVEEIKDMLLRLGYQPVLKDWELIK